MADPIEVTVNLEEGPAGPAGWRPVLAPQMDGSRIVIALDWADGQGEKPAAGYLGEGGLTESVAAALDFRGQGTAAAPETLALHARLVELVALYGLRSDIATLAALADEIQSLGAVAASALDQMDQKADSDSPALTGTPTAPTAEAGTNTTQIATTNFVATAISAIRSGVAAAGDTLVELYALITTHTGRTDNPHGVTKEQVGLADVDNTADADKPVSTATGTAITTAIANVRTLAGDDTALVVRNTLDPDLDATWTIAPGRPSLYEGQLIIATGDDITDLASHQMRLWPGYPTAFSTGVSVPANMKISDSNVGSLAYYKPFTGTMGQIAFCGATNSGTAEFRLTGYYHDGSTWTSATVGAWKHSAANGISLEVGGNKVWHAGNFDPNNISIGDTSAIKAIALELATVKLEISQIEGMLIDPLDSLGMIDWANSTYFGGEAADDMPAMTGATTGGYTASASAQYDANQAAWKAFDDNESGGWGTPGSVYTGWLQLDCPEERTLLSIHLRPTPTLVGRFARSGSIQKPDGVGGWEIHDTFDLGVVNTYEYHAIELTEPLTSTGFRIVVDANQGVTTSLSIAEVKPFFFVPVDVATIGLKRLLTIDDDMPAMTSATTGGYTAAHSAAYSSAQAGWVAFDGNPATSWSTSSGQAMPVWLSLMFPAERTFRSLSLKPRTSYTHHFPATGKIQISDGAGGWIDHATFDLSGTIDATQYYSIDFETVTAEGFRLYIESNNVGGTGIGIDEINIGFVLEQAGLDVRSIDVDLGYQPDTLSFTGLLVPEDGDLVNTADITLSFSRDGGSTWALSADVTVTARIGGLIEIAGSADVSGQPTGSDCRWRLQIGDDRDDSLTGYVFYGDQ